MVLGKKICFQSAKFPFLSMDFPWKILFLSHMVGKFALPSISQDSPDLQSYEHILKLGPWDVGKSDHLVKMYLKLYPSGRWRQSCQPSQSGVLTLDLERQKELSAASWSLPPWPRSLNPCHPPRCRMTFSGPFQGSQSREGNGQGGRCCLSLTNQSQSMEGSRNIL